MVSSGYYRMHRGWLEHEVFGSEPFDKRSAWAWLIEHACWQPRVTNIKGRPVQLERGQLSFSIRYLAEAWGWHRASIERFLRSIKNRDMVRYETETGQVVITICNYAIYQADEDETETGARQQPRQERDRSETKNKKGKKEEDSESSLRSDSGAHPARRSRKRKPQVPVPDGWAPKPLHYARAAELGEADGWVHHFAEHFRNQCGAKGYLYADHDLAFLDWINRELSEPKPNGHDKRETAGERRSREGRQATFDALREFEERLAESDRDGT